MSCFKRFPLVLSYSFVFALVSSFFFLPGHASAISSSSITPVISSTPQVIDFTQFSFTPSFVVFDFDYTNATNFRQINSSIGVSTKTTDYPFNTGFGDSFCQLVLRSVYKTPSLTCMVDSSISTVYRINPAFPDDFSVDVSMTFYDVLPGPSLPCPDCPVVPVNPYDDKLDKIYHAIILVPAMAFVLYLFFILYSWYCGGRS